MKILIVTWHFPPKNVIAAIRIGKLARYLHQQGHDVRVLTSRDRAEDASLPVEIPQELIIRTDWLDVDRLAHPFGRFRARFGAGAARSRSSLAESDSKLARLKTLIARHYNALFFFPDREVGWTPYVVSAARRLFREWRPDVVFASGPPFSGLVAARLISRFWGVPWIAEYRDRWSDDPYGLRYRTELSKILDARLEAACVGAASGVVTVSEPWAEMYRGRFSLPTAVVYNGFDPADFPPPAPPLPNRGAPLSICHMGAVYAGRDPTPLFRAIAESGLGPQDVQVRFYGANLERVPPLAEKLGVKDHIQVLGSVPYAESLRLQRESDVLLLLQWNSPDEFGNVPGKLFEYFAVQRPVLGLGLESGVPASLIRSKRAGLFSNDPSKIAEALRRWTSEKREKGVVSPLPATVREGYSRDEQYAAFERFAQSLVARRAEAPTVRDARGRQERYAPADLSGFETPFLTVVVDTEEEFDWRAPFSRHAFSVESIRQQRLAHSIFDRTGVVPTYLVDYPVAADADAARFLRALMERGECAIGAQLHPWVNPPYEEELSLRNSFLNNLDPALQERKMEVLTTLLSRQFGVEPTIFKTGRFGFDLSTMPLLRKFGYCTDTSVVPHTSFAGQQGPSFLGFPDQPFWLGADQPVLELPLTCGFSGLLSAERSGLFHKLDSKALRRLHIGGVLARSGLLERIKLSPEGVDLAAQKRLTRALVKRGHKSFVLTYHSSSLVPGGNPYVRSRRDLDLFLQRIEGYLTFFREEIGGVVLSVPEVVARIAGRETGRRREAMRQLAS